MNCTSPEVYQSWCCTADAYHARMMHCFADLHHVPSTAAQRAVIRSNGHMACVVAAVANAAELLACLGFYIFRLDHSEGQP